MMLRRLLAQRSALQRGMCDAAAKPLAGRMADHVAKTRQLEFKLDVMEKDALIDVVLGLVKSNQVSVEQVQARLPSVTVGLVQNELPSITSDGTKLRYEIGRAVECRLGPDEWGRGTVVGHFYREDDWPEGQKAPYQVLLEGDDLTARTVWAPADNDECIRGTVRFALGAAVQCCVGNGQWVRGEVVAHYYREDNWPAQLLAPYRVRLEVDPSANDAAAHEVFIWAPLDSDECIRAADMEPLTLDVASQGTIAS